MNCQLVIVLWLTFSIGVLARNVRIVGGENADIEDFPYVVSLGLIGLEKNTCAGVIISNWHILTAAHCVNEYHRFKYKITIGSKTLKIPIEDTYRILTINIYPKYTNEVKRESMYLHDIAIVTLDKCIRFNKYQNKIKLPTKNIGAVENAVTCGWGRILSTILTSPDILQKTTTNILENSECSKDVPFIVSSTQMCTLKHKGVGACYGDSGSPLVYNDELVGIGSFVHPCATGAPDIYTRIYPYLDFITSVISDSELPMCAIS